MLGLYCLLVIIINHHHHHQQLLLINVFHAFPTRLLSSTKTKTKTLREKKDIH
uniref:Uncharacterized protein n=1 Tax=Anguilla anguilla TaxID=7936 RepID=A0A0E9SMH0_ANGAN